MGNPLLVNTLSGPVCWTATDMSPARSYPSSDVLDSNRSSNTALPDATRPGDGMVHSILFSSPIPKRKDRLEKYSNPGIGDTVKRFYGAELCQSSRRTATRASSTFWITPANSTRDSQRNSGTGIQDTQSCYKEEQLLWSKSLSPSSSSLYFTTLPRASITPTSRTDTVATRISPATFQAATMTKNEDVSARFRSLIKSKVSIAFKNSVILYVRIYNREKKHASLLCENRDTQTRKLDIV
ncbi:hypothetical protein ALC57_05446 [Trachymyrmex cornetzi]|uniref:Uncharacterized protein n=1 Tax=Trachymyrmex cornetzi TaxID=471704 RepID=A0A195EBF4_9HYME|nr:hypothetical protein ALC57_05446 [Trachymyrmex cornetzi]